MRRVAVRIRLHDQGRWPHRADQGTQNAGQRCSRGRQAVVPLSLLAALLLPACADGRLAEIDPRPGIRNVFGAHLEGREPPPGLDRPYPNLASVPQRPAAPAPQLRAGITQALTTDRAGAAAPRRALRRGEPPIPAAGGPPAPPRLAVAPAVRMAPVAPAAPVAVPQPPPARQPAPTAPAAQPMPAPAGPPPAPERDLLAPPPPGLLAPAGPPAAPPSDLLAPRR
jgi:hypothetical protein